MGGLPVEVAFSGGGGLSVAGCPPEVCQTAVGFRQRSLLGLSCGRDRLSIVAISSSDDGKDEGEKLCDIPLVLCCKSWGLSSSYACHEPSSYAWHRVISFDIERFSGSNS
ncbi:hypothetical protein LWI28_014390 [Acer negundo]|uniref:Uncharacterized protein n=1 Tax=Acer negundo TaxID=4023 RepID=A0AAD5P488_ACENE|nr:hypothetical protein LWI28_014390 [Acer negundo]